MTTTTIFFDTNYDIVIIFMWIESVTFLLREQKDAN